MADTGIKAVTFDYFGTLVDVEAGASAGMAKVLQAVGRPDLDPVKTYLHWDELNVQRYRGGTYRRYRDVAVDAMAACLEAAVETVPSGARLTELTDIYLSGLADDSPPQPEVPAVLQALAGHGLRLMPITNMDSDLWRRTSLAGHFSELTTAEMAKAYKPSERIFQTALDKLGLTVNEVLHVAISPWADIEGAKPLGFKVAWINRNDDRLGPWTPRPDYEFRDVQGVAALFAAN